MSGRKHTILVVDDERTNIDALAQFLKPKYTILVAKDGARALEVARKNHPDLILLDVMMPGMSGFEVLTQLKSADSTRAIPVIFITGRDNAEDEELGFFLGAVDYITKPFHTSVVLARVKTHLQMSEYIRTIERLGMLDALTNIPNRRSFDRQLAKEWERAVREKSTISLLIMDVDFFKKYNDTYGHPQGDVLLSTVADLCKHTLKRPADFAARWGGEEFVVLLPNTDVQGALDVAEQIRTRIAQAVVLNKEGEQTKVTVSIGVNTASPVLHSNAGQLLVGADKALYNAKNSGRNRVCLYQAEDS